MIAALQQLAARLDAEWRAAGYKPRLFPALAARSLAELGPQRGDPLAEIAGWVSGTRDFPAACNPFGPLGHPAFTVWSNGRFYVNLYAYLTPEVVVHDHNFAGAFVNLAGRTVHCTYAFAHGERVDPSVRVGDVALDDVEMIKEGMVRRIEPGTALIHQVWHVSRPTIVLIIRTPALSGRAARQFQYLRPAIATEVFRDPTLSRSSPERFQYTSKVAECLRGTPGAVPYVSSLVEREHPWHAVWHLVDHWQLLETSGTLGETIERAAQRHGAWFRAMERAGRKLVLFHSINWRAVAAEQDRIVMAMLLTLDSWSRIAPALRMLLPGVAPHDAVLATLRRLSDERAIPLALREEPLALLRCEMQSEGNEHAWKRVMRETFDLSGRKSWSAARMLQRDLREHELLRPLFV